MTYLSRDCRLPSYRSVLYRLYLLSGTLRKSHARTEIYSEADKVWLSISDYPYAKSHCRSAIVLHRGFYFVFGGTSGMKELWNSVSSK